MSLIINCHGGLGNRLRPLLSGISIIDKFKNYKIKIHWVKDRTCDIDYDKLFNQKYSTIKIEEICLLKPYIGFIDNNNLKNYQNILKQTGNNSGQFNIKDKKTIDILLKNNKNIFIDENNYISSSFITTNLYPKIFKSIIKNDIYNNILSTKNNLQLNKSIIGCHLRGTDVFHIDKINLIFNKITNNTTDKFFVCSDMKMLESKFKNHENVILYEKKSYVKMNNINNSWNCNCLRDEASVIEALIDICCLSFCNISNNDYHSHIISTFLNIARIINGWEKCNI
jgi:hypothetical protein